MTPDSLSNLHNGQSAQKNLSGFELATALADGGRGRIIEMDESERRLPRDDGASAVEGANLGVG